MSQYGLTIQFETADVHNINKECKKLTIVKKVGGQSGNQVAWITFNPFENNEVNWTEKYGVYASSTEVKAGATIAKISAVNPASDACLYPFETGAFNDPETGIDPNDYAVKNMYKDGKQFTFGLAQSVTANGSKFDASPLNAIAGFPSDKLIFTPIEVVSVFLHAHYDNGVIISNVDSEGLEVDLTDVPEQTIHYDHNSGLFVPGPLV